MQTGDDILFNYNCMKNLAGVVGFEPTVHGIKTRGYCYPELIGDAKGNAKCFSFSIKYFTTVLLYN